MKCKKVSNDVGLPFMINMMITLLYYIAVFYTPTARLQIQCFIQKKSSNKRARETSANIDYIKKKKKAKRIDYVTKIFFQTFVRKR